MKYFSYFAIAVAIFGIVLASCDKDDIKAEKDIEFTVYFNSNGGSAVLPRA